MIIKPIDLVKAFSLLVVVVGILTLFFFSEYVSAILLGTVYSTKNPTNTTFSVTGDSFIANATTFQNLTNGNITEGTISIYNSTETFWIDHFNIHYVNGSVLTNPTTFCYQETSNATTTCGGLGTGIYNWTGAWGTDSDNYTLNTWDGDYSTAGKVNFTSNATMLINYSKPGRSTEALWQVSDNEGTANLTIDAGCFSQAQLQLRAFVACGVLNNGTWSCYDGSDWNMLRNSTNSSANSCVDVHEEAVFWNISNSALLGDTLSANYNYIKETPSSLQITAGVSTLLDTQEDDFITTFGYVNTGVKFAAGLITVVVVIIIFSSMVRGREKKKGLDY